MRSEVKVLVPGATGFIGPHVCRALEHNGHTVFGLDRRDGLDLLRNGWHRFLAGADAVVHLAGRAGTADSWGDFADYWRNNVLATQRVLDAMLEVGVNRLVYISSSSVYGAKATGDESRPLHPVSPYGVSKAATEMLVRAYERRHSYFLLSIVRPFTVYGPGQRPNMYHHIFIDRLLRRQVITIDGDGSQSRACTYVSDLADAIALVLDRGVAGGAYNVCGDEVVSVSDVLRDIAASLHIVPDIIHGPRRPGDQDITAGSTERIRTLGWTPKVSFVQGLAAQIEWQK